MAGRVAIAVLLFSIATCSVAQMWPFKDHEYSKWDNAGAALFPSDFVTWPMRGNGKEAPGLHYGSVFLPGKNITGNYFLISYPAKRLAVYPPAPAQCGVRVATTETAKKHGCWFATNAGFFNVRNGDCIGNLVSDSNIIQTADGRRTANFGIRGNNFTIGYINGDDIHNANHPFTQLVAGAGWLVREGVDYLQTAMQKEQISQEFVDLMAPRLAIGHTKEGALLVIEVNGYEPEKRGITLTDLTKLALSYGAVNMVNLDGGGSVTTVLEGKIMNPCSDKCTAQQPNVCPFGDKCERTVTSIICVK